MCLDPCWHLLNTTHKELPESKNDVLKALAGTNWGQQSETLLHNKALGRSIANYAEHVWSTYTSNNSMDKIQRARIEALRISAGSHKMSSVDHVHRETKMLKLQGHFNIQSAQYLVHCLYSDNVCHYITTMDKRPRQMKGKSSPDTIKLCYRC